MYVQLDTNLRPMHCSDSKREIIYIKNDDQWEKNCEEKDLLTDINTILTSKFLQNKNIIIVPHINSKVINRKKSVFDTRNIYIQNRQLICKILMKIPEIYDNVIYFDPMKYLPDDPEFIYQSKNGRMNFGHYTPNAEKLVKTQLCQLIDKITNN